MSVDFSSDTIKLAEFAKWAMLTMQWEVPAHFRELADRASVSDSSAPSRAVADSANHHRSDRLQVLLQASDRFWRNANREDRSTHQTNAIVAAWLVKSGKFSQSMADTAASIIRPEWAPTGRKPEE
jgi:hypothetical protein